MKSKSTADKELWSMLVLLGERNMPCCRVDPVANVYWQWIIQGCTFKSGVCSYHDEKLKSTLETRQKLAESIQLKREATA